MERERLTSKDLDPELWAIFDDYVHGFIDRRGFLGLDQRDQLIERAFVSVASRSIMMRSISA